MKTSNKPSSSLLVLPVGGGMLVLTAAFFYVYDGKGHTGSATTSLLGGQSAAPFDSAQRGLPIIGDRGLGVRGTPPAPAVTPSNKPAPDPKVNAGSAAIVKAVLVNPAAGQDAGQETAEIRRAVPVTLRPAAPSSIYEPFKTSLSETLRMEVPQALPLPMVYQAVLMNDKEWLAQLLKSGFGANEETPLGDTALCAAVKSGDGELVEMLLLHGADPNKSGRDGQPPVALASLRRSPDVLPVLLRAGADPNATFVKPVPDSLIASVPFTELKYSLRKEKGVTPLMAAAARGDVEATQVLLQHGARANKPTTTNYRYPINFAADQRFIFIMRILLGRPADSEPKTLVTVDLSQQRAVLRRYGQIIDTTKVSTGRDGYETPSGRYVITDKHKQWTSNVYHVQMPWFMRLNCSAIGLHAGYVTGNPASHGCIRLPPDTARKWFGLMEVGDEVQIVP